MKNTLSFRKWLLKITSILPYLTIVIFILFLVLPTMIYPFVRNYINSTNTENRQLAQKPVFKLSEASTYPSLYEMYFNDNLAFKNQFVKLNTYANLKLFNDLDSNNVLYGKEDWLFYKAIDDGNPIACYKGTNLLRDDELLLYKDKLLQTKDRLQKYGKEFILFIAPNKEQVYSEYMPDSIEVVSDFSRADQLVNYLEKTTDLQVVYPYDELVQYKEEYKLFYKNDTHWNELGGFIGAQQLIKKVTGSRMHLEELDITITNEEVGGDLANMENLQDILPKDKKTEILNYRNSIKVESIPCKNPIFSAFTSTSELDKSILILGDSFREAMGQYINKTFSKLFSYHNGHATLQDIIDASSDIIVIEVVERYIPNILYVCNNLLEAYP